jgi:EAL domain-containing protein (putative c-di-GMP-specific phosphodiesterase class I)/GGDEF domain-containing protein
MKQETPPQNHTIEHIIHNGLLTPLFQPIINLKKNKIYGYEALIRGPSNSPLHSPLNLFDAASRAGLLAELDLLCRETVIEYFGRLNLPHKLFINTIPAVLLQDNYQQGLTLSFLEKNNIDPENVVIELTEQYPIDDYDLMRNATEHYREMGFSIAIDDLGAGYSGLRTWSELKPDYVKIDRHFMQNIHEDQQKKQFVKSMLDIAKEIDCKVIGEGIEVREEYLTTNDIKLPMAQGYYFSRPEAKPPVDIDESLFTQRKSKPLFRTLQPRSNTIVKSLLQTVIPVYSNEKVNDVSERFNKDVSLTALPVVNNDNQPIGIVWRDDFLTLFASRYGRDLHGRKSINEFMDKTPTSADIEMPLKELSQLITSHEDPHQHSMFIITEENQYRGLGSLMDLLRQITDLQITSARHANPLSGLPGNVPISERIKDILDNQLDVTICYFDLDNFKPYNDIYGFGKGDKVIRQTAKVLCDHVNIERDFVGHVGGDDFIVIFASDNWKQRCSHMLQDFTELYKDFYKSKDLKAGGINALDRHGKEMFYQLLSLSVGAVRVLDFDDIKTEADITELATKAKSIAKKTAGNSIHKVSLFETVEQKAQDILEAV